MPKQAAAVVLAIEIKTKKEKEVKSHLGLKINELGYSSVAGTCNVLERGLQSKRLLDPDAIDEGQTRPSALGSIREDERDELRRKSVEIAAALGSEEGDHLLQGLALGPSSDQAEYDMDRLGREDDVGAVVGSFGKYVFCGLEGEIREVADGFAEIHLQ